MSDELAEFKDLIPLNEIPRLLPRRGGKPIHIRTVRRWVLKGLKGRRLRAVRIGGRYYVSEVCLHEFLNPDYASRSSRHYGPDLYLRAD